MPVCWNVLELCRSASVVDLVWHERAFKRGQDSAVPVRVLFADDLPSALARLMELSAVRRIVPRVNSNSRVINVSV